MSVNILRPERLYILIYMFAKDMDFDRDELDSYLCAADTINEMGIRDPHELAYQLAAAGHIDEAVLNDHVRAADDLAREG